MTTVQDTRAAPANSGNLGSGSRDEPRTGQLPTGGELVRSVARAFGIELPASSIERLLATESPVERLANAPDTLARYRSPAPDGGGTYVVRAGDTLSAIADRSGQSLQSLLAKNPGLAAHADLIRPGDRVNVGGDASKTYVVAPGDTLSGIAARHDTSWSALARLNGLANPDRLSIGQTLQLPSGEAARSPARTGAVAPATAAPPRADGVIAPGRASVEAARYAEQQASGHPSIGRCYAWVKTALQHSGAVSDYLPGVAAKGAGPALEARGFQNVLGDGRHAIRSAYDAPVGAVLVYGASAGATDRNARYGHIEIRTASGFASDYSSPRARTGPAENGLEGRGRVLIGVYVKPDAGAAAPAAPPADNSSRYTAANLDLGVNETYRTDILHAAQLSGLPPQTVAAVISAEAAVDRQGQWRADSYNADSGATGLTQFVSGTWLGEARSSTSLLNAELTSRGIDPATASDRSLLALRTDSRLSIVAGVSYATSNIASLQAGGAVPRNLDPAMTAKVAYIAHHEGLGGARAFFRGDIVAVDSKWSGNVPASQRADYLARSGGDREGAYHAWLTDYTNSRIDVTRYMTDGGNGRAASVATLVR